MELAVRFVDIGDPFVPGGNKVEAPVPPACCQIIMLIFRNTGTTLISCLISVMQEEKPTCL